MILFLHRRRKTVKEVIDQLEEEGHFDSANVYMEPPSDGETTEEDSADEDDPSSVNNLSGRQLRSAAVTTIRRHGDVIHDDDDSDDGAGVSEESTTINSRNSAAKKTIGGRSKQTKGPSRKWSKHDLNVNAPNVNIPNKHFDGCNDPVSLFEMYFDEEVCQFIVSMTNKYASVDKGDHSFEVTLEEIRCFLSIILLSGYLDVPRWRMMWEVDSETFNPFVSNAMRRAKFEKIKRFLHCSNNDNLIPNDKFAKMRPLMSLLNERYLNNGVLEENLCVDESMAPYYGRHGAKQYIKGKPIRFGFKFWCLCNRLGYLYQFEPYQSGQYDKEIGLGASVVTDLVSELPMVVPFKLYGDRFFTSLKLLETLKSRGIFYTGTVMSNRIEKCPVISPKDLAKKERGFYDYQLDSTAGVIVVAWNDNRPVCLTSTVSGVNPVGTCQRWSASEKKKVTVTVPNIVSEYNKFMGGVDRMDENIGAYRISVRSKKWWWAVFVFCVETSVHNAWQVYRNTDDAKDRPLDFLSFRRVVVKTYLMKYADIPKGAGKPKSGKKVDDRVPSAVRFDSNSHWSCPAPKQNRCALCRKNSTKMCEKCGVNLHEACFKEYHMK